MAETLTEALDLAVFNLRLLDDYGDVYPGLLADYGAVYIDRPLGYLGV